MPRPKSHSIHNTSECHSPLATCHMALATCHLAFALLLYAHVLPNNQIKISYLSLWSSLAKNTKRIETKRDELKLPLRQNKAEHGKQHFNAICGKRGSNIANRVRFEPARWSSIYRPTHIDIIPSTRRCRARTHREIVRLLS